MTEDERVTLREHLEGQIKDVRKDIEDVREEMATEFERVRSEAQTARAAIRGEIARSSELQAAATARATERQTEEHKSVEAKLDQVIRDFAPIRAAHLDGLAVKNAWRHNLRVVVITIGALASVSAVVLAVQQLT